MSLKNGHALVGSPGGLGLMIPGFGPAGLYTTYFLGFPSYPYQDENEEHVGDVDDVHGEYDEDEYENDDEDEE